MTQMTVTRALVELKRLDDRILKAIVSGKFVDRTIGRDTHQKIAGSNDSVETVKATIQGSFDKVDALIQNRQNLKSAIIVSNAATQVTIMGRTMSVAEAIELKKTVEFRQEYLKTLRMQLATQVANVETSNSKLEASIDASLQTIYGAEKSKIDANLLDAVATPQKRQKESALFDPADVKSKIAALEEEISQLTSELDFILSESNARTVIDVAQAQV